MHVVMLSLFVSLIRMKQWAKETMPSSTISVLLVVLAFTFSMISMGVNHGAQYRELNKTFYSGVLEPSNITEYP